MRHPHPHVLANHLRAVANALDANGLDALDMVDLLCAAGYPTSTVGGNHGSGPTIKVRNERGDDERVPVTGVELAALTADRWAGRDARHRKLLRFLWKAGLDYLADQADILAHASDDDPTPAGKGKCRACDHVCDPQRKGNHDDRLRSGYCDACRKAWVRAGRPDRHTFETDRLRKVEVRS